MKKFKTHYEVVGSSALSSELKGKIIEFPSHEAQEASSSFDNARKNPLSTLYVKVRARIFQHQGIQALLAGSVQGKPFNKAKPWQSFLVGSCFFAFAFASIFIGR